MKILIVLLPAHFNAQKKNSEIECHRERLCLVLSKFLVGLLNFSCALIIGLPAGLSAGLPFSIAIH